MPKCQSGPKAARKGRGAVRAASAAAAAPDARSYTHPDAIAALRPDVGVQKRIRQKKLPKTYPYDTAQRHARDKRTALDLFGYSERSVAGQLLRASCGSAAASNRIPGAAAPQPGRDYGHLPLSH